MTYQVSCAAVGAGSCKGAFEGATEDELVEKVSAHLRSEHKVAKVSQTLVNLVIESARQR